LLDVYRLFVFDAIAVNPQDQVLVDQVQTAVSGALEQTLASYFMVPYESGLHEVAASVRQGGN